MKKLFLVLNYIRDYKTYAVLNIIFNIFYALLAAATLALVAPFIDLLFKNNTEELLVILTKGEPEFSFSSSALQNFSNFYLASLIISKGKVSALMLICFLVFVITFFKNVCRYLAMFFIAPIRNGVVRDLRNKMFAKSLQLPLSYYSEEKKGDLMSRMTNDVVEIEMSIMQTLEIIFREPLTIIILFGIMILISVKLTLFILLLLPIAALVIALLGKRLKSASAKSKETLGGLISIIEETLGSLKVIKAFTAENLMGKKFQNLNQTYYYQSVKVYRQTDLSSPLSESIVMGILMLILFLGGVMVFNNEISGALFITYFGLASQLIPPIKQITVSFNNIQKGLASEERIHKILNAPLVITNKNNAEIFAGIKEKIEFKNMSFAYKKGDEGFVLKNINLIIPKGKTIAFVGQSGSGKTTLADMMARFYDCDSGDILFDNKSIKDFDIESLRKRIGIVTQESILFNDTISNNIRLGNDQNAEVIEAAKVANAHEFIEPMPLKYESNIGDRGSKLSGGQKQRISIARAVLRNPEILILDEATSSLDSESEKLVQGALNNLMKNRTCVVIAHRLSTIMNANEIVVLNKGEIVERGNHSALLSLNGAYKKLYDAQNFK